METDDFTWLLFRWKPPDVSGRQARGFGFASFNDLTRKSMEGVSLTASKSVNVVTGISLTHTHALTGDMIVRLKITKNGRLFF